MSKSNVWSPVAIAVLCLGSNAALAQEIVEVFPTSLYPDDVVNVQAALDSFADGIDGIVVLKAKNVNGMDTAFDFGQDPDPLLRGSVSPAPDQSGAIEFRGERSANGQTVIVGGFVPILTDRHDEIAVRNIEFRGAFDSAISVRETTGVLITDNFILDTEGDELSTAVTRPVEVAANSLGSLTEITGQIVIRRNEIVGATGYFAQGIAINSPNATVLISDNSVTGMNVAIQLLAYQQSAVIRGNILEAAVPRPGFFGSGIELRPGTEPDARVYVSGNWITAGNPHFPSGFINGIDAAASNGSGEVYGDFHDSRIASNEFWIDNGDGIDLYIDVESESRNISDIAVSGNVFHGMAIDAIWLDMFNGSGRILDNRMVLNDFSDITVSSAHLWLGSISQSTLAVVRPDDIVVDNGTTNTVIVLGSNPAR